MKIFPKEIVENTIQVHEFSHSKKSRIIYLSVLILLMSGLVSLPFVYITIYTSSAGILRSDKERTSLEMLYSGKVKTINLKNNQKVSIGDILLVLESKELKEKDDFIGFQLKNIENQLKDLQFLNTPPLQANSYRLRSLKYKKEYNRYSQELKGYNDILQKKTTDYSRQQKLYESHVIARVELENSLFDYEQAQNNLSSYLKQQQNNWQISISELENKHRDLLSSKNQLEENNKNYSLIATSDGVLSNIKGLQIGSYIQAGVSLGEISPSSKLIVECYVSPLDIGLLKLEDTCNFQIDAFNYNQWGLATGSITEISDDVQMIDSKPVFKVRCQINQEFMLLKNGFEGKLIKGMTLNARFPLTRRSLYELLYDKMDDWLNPNNK